MDAMINGNNVNNCVTVHIIDAISHSNPFKLHYNFKPFYWLITKDNNNIDALSTIPSIIPNIIGSEQLRSNYLWAIDSSDHSIIQYQFGWEIARLDDFNYDFQPDYKTTSTQIPHVYVTAFG